MRSERASIEEFERRKEAAPAVQLHTDASIEEFERRKEAAPAVQLHTDWDAEWSSSDTEPDTGGREALEPVKEEATGTCSTSNKKAQKQKSKRKSKKSKRGGKK
jgi:hypothetical protein